MRTGFNPNKDKELLKSDFWHQVIVPVYIPDQQGYFKDSFQILIYCLESLFKTSHSKTYFTIVNNGSGDEVVNYLNQLHKDGKIQEIIHTTSIGKLNAILKGLTGQQFPLITITDADVLFLSDWQKSTYNVFEAFPKTGVVSPVPNSKLLRYYTAPVIWNNLFSKGCNFTKVENSEAMLAFAKSIGNPSLFQKVHLDKNLTISDKNVTALIGAGHFVATYKGICFDNLQHRFSNFSLGGDSEQKLLDRPANELGLWRLSTQQNFAYHMGNTKEDWMIEELDKIIENNSNFNGIELSQKVYSSIWNKFIIKFFSKFIFQKSIWLFYIKYKGLNKDEAAKY